ncbi:Flp pilus assembly protein CpaB [Arthrobacter pigmenti]|uniref:Flp pilus assembly protein CpaB n=1 Tax=Arthrobacter pigmenti TaxID=271432 RepID=A0A846RVL9_9MICC|nr:Flp pilus assembly protein CpaB [Arthrobacter pigmenti]NJC23076.1 Flp pilus assembly protein CpaB [Arthrobacter pigmenti]
MSASTRPANPLSTRVRSFLFRKRRLLAAGVLCVAAGVAVEALLPAEAETTPVVAAAADLPVGSIITADQLALVHLPREAVPKHAYSSAELVTGQQLATPVYAGDVIAENFLVGEGLLAGTDKGTVAVPLRPADASTVQLLSPGQRVDVVLSTGNGFEVSGKNTVIAKGLPILWTSEEPASGPFSPAGSQQDGLVVVAANPDEAATLAGASSSGQVHLVLTGGG